MNVSSRSAFLAAEHRRNVAEFVEAIASIVPGDLGIEERNELEAKVRFQVENGLVPGLLAVVAFLLEASPQDLNRDLPRWIERVSTVLPVDAEALTEAGRQVDPAGYTLLSETMGLTQDKALAVDMFHSHLLSLAPCVPRAMSSYGERGLVDRDVQLS